MCLRPLTLKNTSRKYNNDIHLNTVPCGKCVRCINKIRTEWAFRLYEETKDHSYAYFITLTYNEQNLPFLNLTTGQYPTRIKDEPITIQETDQLEKIVYKKDVQDFIKNIRRQQSYFYKKKGINIKEQTKEHKLRYYGTSEYGTKLTKRPHYHIIIWNLHPQISQKLERQKIWTKGFADVKPLDKSVKSFYYLTKYLYKQKNYDIWTFKPFSIMSTKPYIGNRYLETSKKYHIGKTDLITKFNNKDLLIPRIYRDKLPQWLFTNTKKILEKQKHKRENDTFKKTNKKNHHPDILEIYKKIKQEQLYIKEQNHFKNLFK